MGLSWLWVDALCIIQDSLKDWENEAERMRDVYEGALISIAALAATGNSQGLLASVTLSSTLFFTSSNPSVTAGSIYALRGCQSPLKTPGPWKLGAGFFKSVCWPGGPSGLAPIYPGNAGSIRETSSGSTAIPPTSPARCLIAYGFLGRKMRVTTMITKLTGSGRTSCASISRRS